MNYDEMRGKHGASMLYHVATLVGQDQFFSLLLNNGSFSYCGNVKGPISLNIWCLSVYVWTK